MKPIRSKVAVAALVVAIVGIVPIACVDIRITWAVELVALILGAVGLARIKRDQSLGGRRLAIAAIVVSVVGSIALGLAMLAFKRAVKQKFDAAQASVENQVDF